MEADWILGAWRIDSYIKGGQHSREVLLHLNFLPEGLLDVVDETKTSNLAQRCRWRPQMGGVFTSCGGVDMRIRDRSSGPVEVELEGSIRVPYYVEECGRWTVDANGNRVCAYYRELERFRAVSARGEGVMEPAGRPGNDVRAPRTGYIGAFVAEPITGICSPGVDPKTRTDPR